MKVFNEPKKPSYVWEIFGVIIGLFIFFTAISFDEKESATGVITYNDEGMISFQSHGLDAFYGLLLSITCIVVIYSKKRKAKKNHTT